MTAKLSISLSDKDVEYLDRLLDDHTTSRSAAVHQIIRRMRELDAEDAYRQAMEEWEESGDAELWDQTAGDGLDE